MQEFGDGSMAAEGRGRATYFTTGTSSGCAYGVSMAQTNVQGMHGEASPRRRNPSNERSSAAHKMKDD
jgi:hypothetical protein